jgi:outer membrane immunogenic protein
MKKFLMASALAMLSGISGALAADLPSRMPPPVAPVYIPPPFTWTGFYVGANAGYGWLNGSGNGNNLYPLGAVPVAGFLASTSRGSNSGGFLGGVQAGYNYQFGAGAGFVLGIESDLDYAQLGRNNGNGIQSPFGLPAFPGTVFTPSNVVTGNGNNQYLGTVRLRAGYAWDRFFLFGTGGLAYGGINRNGGLGGGVATTAAGFVNPFTGAVAPVATTNVWAGTGRNSRSGAGWTLGFGGEYAFTQNWTVKAEYLYVNFGNGGNNNTAVTPFLVAAARNNNNGASIIRLGVNYKFW